MTIGIVYCAVCESYPGRCKIGKTFRNAPQRIGELQRHYRSRHPFTEHASMLTEHYGRVEWLAHRKLAHCREPATEMFLCSPEDAMAAICWAIDEALRNPPVYAPGLKRAPKRWRKARRWWTLELTLAVFTVLLIGLIVLCKPDLPDWLPQPVERTVLRIESRQ